jgi:hypothetical protein
MRPATPIRSLAAMSALPGSDILRQALGRSLCTLRESREYGGRRRVRRRDVRHVVPVSDHDHCVGQFESASATYSADVRLTADQSGYAVQPPGH